MPQFADAQPDVSDLLPGVRAGLQDDRPAGCVLSAERVGRPDHRVVDRVHLLQRLGDALAGDVALDRLQHLDEVRRREVAALTERGERDVVLLHQRSPVLVDLVVVGERVELGRHVDAGAGVVDGLGEVLAVHAGEVQPSHVIPALGIRGFHLSDRVGLDGIDREGFTALLARLHDVRRVVGRAISHGVVDVLRLLAGDLGPLVDRRLVGRAGGPRDLEQHADVVQTQYL